MESQKRKVIQHFNPFGFNGFCSFKIKVIQVSLRDNSKVWYKNHYRAFHTDLGNATPINASRHF